MKLKDIEVNTGWCTVHFGDESITICSRLDLNDSKRKLTELTVDSNTIETASNGSHIVIKQLKRN